MSNIFYLHKDIGWAGEAGNGKKFIDVPSNIADKVKSAEKIVRGGKGVTASGVELKGLEYTKALKQGETFTEGFTTTLVPSGYGAEYMDEKTDEKRVRIYYESAPRERY